MALFGEKRDISLFRLLGRELIHDIISQQVAFYKYNLAQTKVNMYGEATSEKYYIGPVLFNCLVERKDRTASETQGELDFSQNFKFTILRDDLVDSNYVPEVGDIILYEESFCEVHNIIENQQYSGKNPDYPNTSNPLNGNLVSFGWNASLIVEAHSINEDRPGIFESRLI